MTVAAASPRIIGAVCALALTAGALAACTPTPEPSPTPTALFSSDEEAFAAAEETYRAYNDAGNARLNGEAQPDPRDFLMGAALDGDIDGQQQLKAAGLKLEGEVRVAAFKPARLDDASDFSQLEATVCLDLTRTTVVTDTGAEAELPNRPELIAQDIELTWVDGSYLISEELEGENSKCTA